MARCLSQLQGRPADVAGTPAYMAVELFNGATASNASDMVRCLQSQLKPRSSASSICCHFSDCSEP